MSGPDYPPDPAAGSNGIGKFTIGVSPIGEIAAFDVWTTILSQYANSPTITALITSFAAELEQTPLFEAFHDDIWNIATAQGYGLDVLGRIIGIGRVIQLPSQVWLGFEEALPGSQEFNFGSLYSGTSITSNYSLTDSVYRQLLYAKALTNISNGSIPSINRALMILFPNRGNAYVAEGVAFGPYFGFAESTSADGFGQAPLYAGETVPTMQLTYIFDFPLSAAELAIVNTSGVLPKPVGVQANVVTNA